MKVVPPPEINRRAVGNNVREIGEKQQAAHDSMTSTMIKKG